MPNVPGYSRLQIWLHWSIAALLLISYVSSDGMKSEWRALLRQGEGGLTGAALVHLGVGVLILALTAIRLFHRLGRGVPNAPPVHPALDRIARLTHWAIYAILLALPVSGLLAWYGGIREVGELHEILFNAGLALIGLHVAAALFHQYVLRDGSIGRMIRAR